MRTDLPWDGILSDDNVRVTVNGKRWPVRSVKIQKGMRDGHPAAKGVLNGAWCIEATIEWAQERLVDTQVPQPFTGIDDPNLDQPDFLVPRAGASSRKRPSGAATEMGYGVIGSPTDSGSVSLGSSPSTPARKPIRWDLPPFDKLSRSQDRLGPRCVAA